MAWRQTGNDEGERKLKIHWSVSLALEVNYKCCMNIHQIYNSYAYSMNYSIVCKWIK
jgi:hypothetical protein